MERHTQGPRGGLGGPLWQVVSTVVTTQIPTKSWHEKLADPAMADAICDRVIHNAHVVALRGPSIREKKGLLNQEPQPTV
jgi:DNA replication protein DnaC